MWFYCSSRKWDTQKGVLALESSMLILHSSNSVQIEEFPRTLKFPSPLKLVHDSFWHWSNTKYLFFFFDKVKYSLILFKCLHRRGLRIWSPLQSLNLKVPNVQKGLYIRILSSIHYVLIFTNPWWIKIWFFHGFKFNPYKLYADRHNQMSAFSSFPSMLYL